MKRVFSAVLVLILGVLSEAFAHFGMILPSDDIVSLEEKRKVALKVMFLHPFEQQWMNWGRPKRFGVLIRGKQREDLTGQLKPLEIKGKKAWSSSYKIKRPGDHVFFVEPRPYWEPAEGKFIIHYTKVVVNAFGLEEGWDQRVGFPIEIVPLTRPYGLWTGNVFRGLVLLQGKPAPFIDVEVEYFNRDGIKPPAEPFVTQVIRTDSQGVFTYCMPRAGWWGFAALADAPFKIKRDGKDFPVEIGGVIWVKVEDMR